MLDKIYGIIFVILIGTCAFLGYQWKHTQGKLNTTVAQYEVKLNEKPKTIIVRDTQLQYVYKDGKTITKFIPREGGVSVDVSKYDALVAREDSLKRVQADLKGKLENSLKETLGAVKDKVIQTNLANDYKEALKDVDAELVKVQAQLVKPENYVQIKNKGFIFRPTAGIGYNGNLAPYLGIKLGYWNRYGISIGTTDKQAGIGVSRHIDDVLPFLRNTEGVILLGYPYKATDGKIFVGISVGL